MCVFNQRQTYFTDNNSVFILDVWNKDVRFHSTVQVACRALYAQIYTTLRQKHLKLNSSKKVICNPKVKILCTRFVGIPILC